MKRPLVGFPIAILLIGTAFQLRVLASGVVNNCDEPSLRVALSGGGLVTFNCDGTIVLSNTIDVAVSTTIDATGHAITISGNQAVRVFTVTNSSTLSLVNLTIANGRIVGADNQTNGMPGARADGGGALVSGATLVAVGCRFELCSATGGTGGGPTSPGISSGGTGGEARGGAIALFNGTLAATNCFFDGNICNGGRGGLGAGAGADGFGGAILGTNSLMNFDHCNFETNEVHGGRIGSQGNTGSSQGGHATGGAICSQGGSVTILDCVFVANKGSTDNPGADFNVYPEGMPSRGAAINIDAGGVAMIAGSTFSSNQITGGFAGFHAANPGPGQGGAICNFAETVLLDCVFDANIALGGFRGNQGGDGQGGALYNGGSMRTERCWLRGNWTQGAYGGSQFAQQFASGNGKGGAVYNAGTFVSSACTFSENACVGLPGMLAIVSTPTASSGFGGAIFNLGSCNVTNCTFEGNQAIGGTEPIVGISVHNGPDAYGGAFYNATGSIFSANNTFALNQAVGGIGTVATGGTNGVGYGGAIYSTAGGTVALLNTIVANSPSGSNSFGTLVDLGHNLSSDSSCNFTGSGSLNNTDPKLAPLDNYGGPTPTMALLSGSPAIGNADPVSFPQTDQRGRTRPFGFAPDIGAFESSSPYVISGKISGKTLTGEVSVAAGGQSTATVSHKYMIQVPTGPYSVVPQSSNYVFIPASAPVTVGPDQVGVDFTAYRWNTLSLDDVTNGVMHIITAATNGRTVRLQSSSDLRQWTSTATNIIGPSNYWELFLPIGNEPAKLYRTISP
jgi:hypothetical protein